MKKTALCLILLAPITTPKRVFADSGSCILLADNGPVWLRVYEEVGNGQKGSLLFERKLERGEKSQPIKTSTQRIKYDYKVVENDDYHGDVGAWCHNNDTVKVP